MNKPQVSIDYWMDPEGIDFQDLDDFSTNLQIDYLTHFNQQKTDALGGGLYEFEVKVVNDLTLDQLLKSYLEDGVKIVISLYLRPFIKTIKSLFEKNENLEPDLKQINLKFNDCDIYVYSLYRGSLIENFESVASSIIEHHDQISKLINKKIKSLYIPIFKIEKENGKSEFRAKLDVDETIEEFHSIDYFKLWGIRTKKKIPNS